jgi:hypothetical protein
MTGGLGWPVAELILLFCRIEGVAWAHIHAPIGMLTRSRVGLDLVPYGSCRSVLPCILGTPNGSGGLTVAPAARVARTQIFPFRAAAAVAGLYLPWHACTSARVCGLCVHATTAALYR